jgi:hypothetical protein
MSESRAATNKALSIDEITRIIVQNVRLDPVYEDSKYFDTNLSLPLSRDLLALATVNRIFSEYALDRLWRRASFWRLARLMPRELWNFRLGDRSGQYTTAKSNDESWVHDRREEEVYTAMIVSPRDTCIILWAHMIILQQQFRMPEICLSEDLQKGRFFYYSKRVESLCLPAQEPSIGCIGLVDTEVLKLWQSSQHTLFHRLSELCIDAYAASQGPSFRTPFHLLQRGVQRLFVWPTIHITFLDGDDVDVVPFDTELQSFECKSVDVWLIDENWVPFASRVIRLSPHLHTVRLDGYLTWQALFDLSTSHTLCELCAGYMPDLDTIQARSYLPESAFPHLEVVRLSDAHPDTPLFTMFLARASVHRLTDMSLVSRVASGMTIQLYRTCTQHLVRFHRITRLHLDMEISEGTEEGQTLDHERLFLEVMAPLMQLGSLEILSVRTTYFAWQFNEATLVNVISRWPRIRDLRFEHVSLAWDSRTMIFTFRLPALFELLARCPDLVAYEFVIDCSELPSVEAIDNLARLRHPFPGPLRVAAFGDLQPLAAVIRKSLPRVDAVHAFEKGARADSADDEKAEEVTRLLRAA